ncbi:MAG: hypothetical protein Q9O74_03975 [Planctomycetota bacterium]|nr:hypothetical protein [Planctomycetota bacterium]
MKKYCRKIRTGRFGAGAKPYIMTSVIGTTVTAASVAAQYGAPDRTGVTRFMSRSSMVMTDLNNDCLVSDVDVVMLLMDRMAELYGPDLDVGDLDGDGIETSEDIVTAIGFLMKGAFGKTAPDAQGAVGAADIEQTLLAVAAGDVEGDLNFDGDVNAEDLLVTVDRFGEEVSNYDIDQAARLAAEYMGYIVSHGREAFMASGCAPDTHLSGVSDTWPPDRPGWWSPNHLWNISASYDGEDPDGDHEAWASKTTPTGPHQYEVSKQWPANHIWYASNTWLPPRGGHLIFVTYSDDPYHETSVSKAWPPGHIEQASSSRPMPPEHEPTVSRIWWPNHYYSDSLQMKMPPYHRTAWTETWVHETDRSQSRWPPNHQSVISNNWGPDHNMGTSVYYPPGHLDIISGEWPGPQPSWPPGHTVPISESWGDPDSGGWPVFPPDHSWWTTANDLRDWFFDWPW